MFRPLEMYPNIIHNPLKASEEEVQCLSLRRKKEKLLIINLENISQVNQNTWFLIACEWLA